MREQLHPPQTEEQEPNRRKVFQLSQTKTRIGIGAEPERKHPCFPVILTPYNSRWINNLKMSELCFDPVGRTVTIGIEEFEVEGFRRLSLDEVKFDGDILFVGNDGKIACDRV